MRKKGKNTFIFIILIIVGIALLSSNTNNYSQSMIIPDQTSTNNVNTNNFISNFLASLRKVLQLQSVLSYGSYGAAQTNLVLQESQGNNCTIISRCTSPNDFKLFCDSDNNEATIRNTCNFPIYWGKGGSGISVGADPGYSYDYYNSNGQYAKNSFSVSFNGPYTNKYGGTYYDSVTISVYCKTSSSYYWNGYKVLTTPITSCPYNCINNNCGVYYNILGATPNCYPSACGERTWSMTLYRENLDLVSGSGYIYFNFFCNSNGAQPVSNAAYVYLDVTSLGYCTSDSECGYGYVCDWDSQKCLNILDKECVTSSDCQLGLKCVNYKCVGNVDRSSQVSELSNYTSKYVPVSQSFTQEVVLDLTDMISNQTSYVGLELIGNNSKEGNFSKYYVFDFVKEP